MNPSPANRTRWTGPLKRPGRLTGDASVLAQFGKSHPAVWITITRFPAVFVGALALTNTTVRDHVVVQAWVGLVGVVAGAVLALVGQHVLRRSDARERLGLLLLEQCSFLIASSEDYRNRIWEERKGLSQTAVAGWDLSAHRLAQARLKVLCHDRQVHAALTELQESGTALGRSWRLSRQDGPEVQEAWRRHKMALENFLEVSSRLVRRRVSDD